MNSAPAKQGLGGSGGRGGDPGGGEGVPRSGVECLAPGTDSSNWPGLPSSLACLRLRRALTAGSAEWLVVLPRAAEAAVPVVLDASALLLPTWAVDPEQGDISSVILVTWFASARLACSS